MGSTEEPERERKRPRHLNNSISPPLKKQPPLPSAEDKKVDAQMLQYQNEKLAQQLDVQRSEIHSLESKFNQRKSKQASYDANLSSVYNAWGEVVDKVEILAARTNVPSKGQLLDSSLSSKGGTSACISPEQTFLHRLLDTGATESSSGSNGDAAADALQGWQAAILRSMEHLVRAIDSQRTKSKDLYKSLRNGLPSDEGAQSLQKIDDDLRKEVSTLRSAMDTLHLKHKDVTAEVRRSNSNNARDQADIKRLSGELEETIADLETTRLKFATLKNQKDTVSEMPGLTAAGKCEAMDRSGEKPLRDTKALEAALEEAKNFALCRLNELEEAQQEKRALSQQLQQLHELLKGEQRILSSISYTSLSAHLQQLKAEVERHESLMDQLQVEKENALSCEKDANLKAEAGEDAVKTNMISAAKIIELESKLKDCIAERNNLQVTLEEASHALERQDEVAEFKVMVSTLHKEMHMMQQQLNKYKEAACGAQSLQAEVESTSLLLEKKTNDCRCLMDQVADQISEVNMLKDEVRLLCESEQELKLSLEMYGSESTDSRAVRELKQAECRAWDQVERLKSALDEHSLELRVRAANEAEAACQQRLATAEVEIGDLRQRLDASERVVIELNEAIKMKGEEGDTYLAEIETIGQAYEDMQTQNQRLLQQISQRDDYNIKLVSESVKAKQLQASLLEEKQAITNHIQHASSLTECHKQRVSKLEEQIQTCLEQFGKATDDGRETASFVESLKRRSAEAEREYMATKSSLEVVQKELDRRKLKMAEIQSQLEKEKMEKRRVQEDLTSFNSKLTRLNVQTEGGSVIEKLQEEIKEYKAILKCSVCHDRPKEVVITKCYHLFCGPCIQRNLEIRHRKCPGCGITFGQNDVRNVYI